MPKSLFKTTSDILTGLPRPVKQGMMVLADFILLVFSAWSAYSLRFGEIFIPNTGQLTLMLTAPLLAMPIFLRNGLYRSVIRYLGEQAIWVIFRSVTLASILWACLAFMTQMTGTEGVPRAIPILYWLIGLTLVGGSRFVARWLLWLPVRAKFSGRQVLIYGAGESGRQLASSLRSGSDLFPAGFIDDDPTLHGKDIDGCRVYAPDNIGSLVTRFDIHDVIVTLPSITGHQRRRIMQILEQYPVKVRVLPRITDIANGRHLVNMVREVDIGDLLGRDPVAADPALLARCITSKVVMVTGAGGSIGSELARQISKLQPTKLLVLEASEHGLYQIERQLKSFVTFPVIPCLASVCQANSISQLLRDHQVQTIYHAAAHKHVPLVEANPLEGAYNNVFGTKTIAEAAYDAGVETFVLISTDKAVRPTNVMGATKRWAELVIQNLNHKAQTAGKAQRFCAVRFGNVLGSSGSVIPLFREQIGQGGPVTVTHEEVTRYFMSIHEAVELVIQAGSMANGGEIFLLDMGEPVRIIDMARNMIRLAGRTIRDKDNPDGDIEIVVSGLRPGEKLYEELLIADSNATGTSHPKIMKGSEPCLDNDQLQSLLQQLDSAIQGRDAPAARQLLLRIAGSPVSA